VKILYDLNLEKKTYDMLVFNTYLFVNVLPSSINKMLQIHHLYIGQIVPKREYKQCLGA